jgi:ankyrin repeat protein
VLPLHVLGILVTEWLCVPSVSALDVAVTSRKLRPIFKHLLVGNKIDSLAHYNPAYVRFGFLKWLSRRGIVLNENFKVYLPSHPSVLTRDWQTTYANIGPSALTMVASKGSVEVMNLLLAKERKGQSNRLIDDTDGCGFSPLMIAASKNDPNMVRVLLENGANPRLQCFSNDRSALHLACINGSAECVNLLLQCSSATGIDVLAQQDRGGRNGLFHSARNLDILQALLASGPGVLSALHQKDYANGETPLSYFCRKNFHAAADLLLAVPGVDVHHPNRDGRTPLHVSVDKGHLDIVKALLRASGGEKFPADALGETPLELCERLLSLHSGASKVEVTTKIREMLL